MTSPAVAFSHVGITVPDIRAAMAWYVDTLGYYPLVGPLEVLEDNSPLGKAAAGIYGTGFSRFQFAHLAGVDGAGTRDRPVGMTTSSSGWEASITSHSPAQTSQP